MTIIDLSVPLEPNPSEPVRPQVDFEDHDRSAPLVAGSSAARSSSSRTARAGRARPSRRSPTRARTSTRPTTTSRPAAASARATIDELPLDWFLAPGVRLDLRGLDRGAEITVVDLESALDGHELAPLEIVLLWTGRGGRVGPPRLPERGHRPRPRGHGVAARPRREGDRDRRVGAGPPARRPARGLRARRRPGAAVGAHRVGIEREYCQIEKLHNLGALPGATGFTVSCLPVKIAGRLGGLVPGGGGGRWRLTPRASPRCCATTASRCSRASRSSCARARWRRRCCSRSRRRSSCARRGR